MQNINENYCFSLKGDVLYILEENETNKYNIIKKYSASLFLAHLYNDVRNLLNSFYSEFLSKEDMEQSLDKKAATYIKKYGCVYGIMSCFVDENTTISELRTVFDILIDYSEDNPYLCMSSFLKQENGVTFEKFLNEYSPYYQQSFAFLDNQALSVINTTDFVSFVAYICYAADETVRKFKICPTCLNAMVEGNTSRLFCTDAHKSRYNWLVKKEPILCEFKQKYVNLKKTGSENNTDVRSIISGMINWIGLKKYKYDIFDSAFIPYL